MPRTPAGLSLIGDSVTSQVFMGGHDAIHVMTQFRKNILGMGMMDQTARTSFFFFFFFFWGAWSLNSGVHACKASTLQQEPYFQDILLVFLEKGGGLPNYLPGLVSNCDTLDLSLPGSCDYRCEPSEPGSRTSSYITLYLY
jgi:hypothetical protein